MPFQEVENLSLVVQIPLCLMLVHKHAYFNAAAVCCQPPHRPQRIAVPVPKHFYFCDFESFHLHCLANEVPGEHRSVTCRANPVMLTAVTK